MARARKLFPIYGSALANNMFTALGRGRVVDKFVAAYVAEYDRRGILGGPSRDRELAETIGREAMLAMIHEIPQLLPRFFGKKQQASLKDDERQAMDAFFLELMAALGRVWKWNGEDRRPLVPPLSSPNRQWRSLSAACQPEPSPGSPCTTISARRCATRGYSSTS